MDRIAQLKEILQMDESNAFARYGLAMEHSNANDVESALAEFNALIHAHPDYAAGYFMAAQMFERVGRTDEARQWLTDGITAATRAGSGDATFSPAKVFLPNLPFRRRDSAFQKSPRASRQIGPLSRLKLF